MSTPFHRMMPADGRSSPTSIRTVVLLPEPLGPSRPTGPVRCLGREGEAVQSFAVELPVVSPEVTSASSSIVASAYGPPTRCRRRTVIASASRLSRDGVESRWRTGRHFDPKPSISVPMLDAL